MSKKYFPHSYYVLYAVIMIKIYVFISALRVVHLDHDKNILFFISVLRSLGLNHEKNNFPIATPPTTFVMMKIFFSLLLLCSLRRDYHYVHYDLVKKKDILVFISALRSARLAHD